MRFKNTGMFRAAARALLLGAAFALSSTPALATTRITHHLAHFGGTALHHTGYHHHYSHHLAPYALHTGYHYAGSHHLYHYAGYREADDRDYAPTLHAGLHHYRYRHTRFAYYHHSGIQCVPYAREISHIALTGNAFLWWAEASGRYARGDMPAEGAVLNFRAIGRMPLGHVAVVTAVEDSRTILVTQANWVRGSITNDVTVQDVSPANDWTQVKVELGDSSTWGAPYPTYGFIYNRPDTGTIIAAAGQNNEVAEAPAVTQVSDDAPDRNLQ